MQASFQILALREAFEDVQGVLVSVLEKPKVYIPKRKCKVCQVQYEFGLWMPKEDMYACPVCGNLQRLQALKEHEESFPNYYRMKVVRSEEELERDKNLITTRAIEMSLLSHIGHMDAQPMNDLACVDLIRRKQCVYYNNHLNGMSTLDDPAFEETQDYVGKI